MVAQFKRVGVRDFPWGCGPMAALASQDTRTESISDYDSESEDPMEEIRDLDKPGLSDVTASPYSIRSCSWTSDEFDSLSDPQSLCSPMCDDVEDEHGLGTEGCCEFSEPDVDGPVQKDEQIKSLGREYKPRVYPPRRSVSCFRDFPKGWKEQIRTGMNDSDELTDVEELQGSSSNVYDQISDCVQLECDASKATNDEHVPQKLCENFSESPGVDVVHKNMEITPPRRQIVLGLMAPSRYINLQDRSHSVCGDRKNNKIYNLRRSNKTTEGS